MRPRHIISIITFIAKYKIIYTLIQDTNTSLLNIEVLCAVHVIIATPTQPKVSECGLRMRIRYVLKNSLVKY